MVRAVHHPEKLVVMEIVDCNRPLYGVVDCGNMPTRKIFQARGDRFDRLGLGDLEGA